MTTTPAPVAWMNADDAAGALRVSRATLYAYVSRGFIRSQAMPGPSRQRGYSRDDVDRLRRRTEARRDPENAAARALQWGVPVLESAITLIDGNNLYYRGHEATTLARSRSLGEVASLIWTGRFDTAFPAAALGRAKPPVPAARSLSFVARAQTALAHASAHDPLAFDVRPEGAALCGWRILHLLAAAATQQAADPPAIDRALGRAWRVADRGVDVLRAAPDPQRGSRAQRVVVYGSLCRLGRQSLRRRHRRTRGPRRDAPGGASARRSKSMLASMRRTRDVRRVRRAAAAARRADRRLRTSAASARGSARHDAARPVARRRT